MKTKQYDITLLGHDVSIAGPETFADLVEVIGEAAAMDAVVKSQVYRALAPRIRDKYFENVQTGLSIKLEPSGKDAKGKDIWPKDRDCQKQLAQTAGIKPEEVPTKWQQFMDAAASAVDFAEAVKGSLREGTLSKEWLGYGETVLTGVNEKRGGDFSVFLEKMGTLVPNAALPDEPTAEDIGRLLKKFNEAQKKVELTSDF